MNQSRSHSIASSPDHLAKLWQQAQSSSLLPAVILLDDQGRILDLNPQAQSLAITPLNHKASPPTLAHLLEQYSSHPHHPDFGPRLLSSLLAATQDTDQVQEQVICLANSQHQEAWYLARAVRLQPPSQVICLTLQDITRRYQADRQKTQQLAEIADQNRQWQAIFNGVQESIVLVDRSGLIMTMNPATEKITGRRAADMIGRHIAHLFPKIEPSAGRLKTTTGGGFEWVLHQGRPSQIFEALVNTQDNRHIWVNYTYTPLRDSQGQITGYIRVTSDVTQVKVVDQMKNDFISIASHELRTPLGVINSYLNLFLANQLGPLTDDQKIFIQRIYGSSSDMSALVEDLLNMSRIEDGRIRLANQEYSPLELIKEVIAHLEPRYQAKQITIKVSPSRPQPSIIGDRQKVEQALANLIDNAIKYTYDQGHIAIKLAYQPNTITISIADSGVGIRPENLTHIFEKFYREGNPLSIKEGGSGLGLYISQKLIELHGGRITATSKHKQGSIFTVTLPRQPHSTS